MVHDLEWEIDRPWVFFHLSLEDKVTLILIYPVVLTSRNSSGIPFVRVGGATSTSSGNPLQVEMPTCAPTYRMIPNVAE